MDRSDRRFTFRDVIIVADVYETSASNDSIHLRTDLEMTDSVTIEALRSSIVSLGLKCHHYRGPEELARFADRHRDDVVLTIYGGRGSRNRMALVPAICETFRLRYIGPDVYGRIVAQDKEISKRLASDCGLRTPAWRIARSEDDLARISGLSFPVVVKPLLEGSSIGITQRNRAITPAEAREVGRELLSMIRQPIMIEEFVPGREVAYSRIEARGDPIWAFSEVYFNQDPAFFEHRLFDAQEKLLRSPGRTVRNIDEALASDDRSSIDQFLASFGTYGYCRVDGRLAGQRFIFIELTPDAWIAPLGQFAMSFTAKGWDYTDVIAAVLASVDSDPPNLPSNG